MKIKNCSLYFDRFKEYHKTNPAWGSLHIVLEDGNTENSNVMWCVNYASSVGDKIGGELAVLLLDMTITQRRRIASNC